MKLKPRIVASLGRNATRDVLLSEEADMIEVRLDLVEGEPLEIIRAVRKATNLPLIATNRLKAEGGQFLTGEHERIELLREASNYADFVDIELKAELREKLLRMVDKPAIVSYHNFACLPNRKELRSILEEMKKTRAAIAKIAVTPSSLKENLEILDFLLEADTPLCMIAMGEIGRHLRAIAPLYGSALTYGYVSEATAPGQMSVSELRQAMKILDQKFIMH